ncbi:MAG: amidotransferase [Methanomicrobiales archaeon HGW-Methanomicrobiales-4]|nr:MAG: amidotransferase [Methanomicrobiales archaeon HGW-Methanomicrobiales-4]
MTMIRVYSLEHAPYEELVFISQWLDEHRIPHHAVRLFEGDLLPEPTLVDLLLIMGGPMNIYEEEAYPWLVEEKAFIREIIDLGRPVLGICLGGQLIASVLGGRVTRSPVPEYGWHTVQKVPHSFPGIFAFLPDMITVFQWHQDTFQIPPGAVHLYSAKTCSNQAFLYRSHVIGLQFHPEMDESTIRSFLAHSGYELEEKGLLSLQDDILFHIDFCSCGHTFISGVMHYLISLMDGHEKD